MEKNSQTEFLKREIKENWRELIEENSPSLSEVEAEYKAMKEEIVEYNFVKLLNLKKAWKGRVI